MSVESDLLNAILRYVEKHPSCTISISPSSGNGAGGQSEEEIAPAEDEFVEFI